MAKVAILTFALTTIIANIPKKFSFGTTDDAEWFNLTGYIAAGKKKALTYMGHVMIMSCQWRTALQSVVSTRQYRAASTVAECDCCLPITIRHSNLCTLL